MPNTCIWSFGLRSICSSVIYSILIEEGRQCFLQWSDLHLIFPRLQSMLELRSESHDIGKYPTCILDPSSGIPTSAKNEICLECLGCLEHPRSLRLLSLSRISQV